MGCTEMEIVSYNVALCNSCTGYPGTSTLSLYDMYIAFIPSCSMKILHIESNVSVHPGKLWAFGGAPLFL